MLLVAVTTARGPPFWSDLRAALHLHRVASVGEVPVAEPGAVRGQVQASASEVPLLKKGHLKPSRTSLFITECFLYRVFLLLHRKILVSNLQL